MSVKILGPHYCKTPAGADRWRVRVGTRTKSFHSQEEAQQYIRDQRVQRVPAPPADPLPDGSERGKWMQVLSDMRSVIIGEVSSGHIDILQAGRVLSSLASSAAKFVDDEELRHELTDLRKTVREIMTARKHGSRVASTGARAPRAAVSAEPMH